MKQKHYAVVAGIVLSLAGVFAYASFCRPVQAMCGSQYQRIAPQEIKQIAPGYYEYSEGALAEAQKTGKKVVLYFWAPWCTTCSSLDVDIAKDPKLIPDDVVILRIPYDTASALKAKYHVVTQHTFVQIDHQGSTLQLWVGGAPSDFKEKL